MRNLSFAKKLVLGFLVTGLLPLSIVFTVSTYINQKELTSQAFSQLSLSRDLLAAEIENLFEVINKQVLVKSHEPYTVESAKQFIDAYNNYYEEFTAANPDISIDQMRQSVRQFYMTQFTPEYKNRTSGKDPSGLESKIASMDNNTLALQYTYISNNSQPLGSKDGLVELDNGTTWSKIHGDIHPTFREFLNEYGYYDIFIVDAKTGNIVYSVFKEIDFATSLLTGPYASTNFGDVFKKAKQLDGTKPAIVDLDFYFPSYEAPAGFVGNPIKDKSGETIAVLIYQIPVAKLDAILTHDKDWSGLQAGASGETYIVGKEKKMRSISRFFVEDFDGYQSALLKAGVSQSEIDEIKASQNTALLQSVDSTAVQAAINGKVSNEITVDYRGEPVLSSYKKLNIDGLDWYILSEKDEAEVLASIKEAVTYTALIALIAGLAILFAALIFAKQTSKTLVDASQLLRTSAVKANEMGQDLVTESENLASAAVQNAAATQQSVASITEIGGMVHSTKQRAEDSKTLLNEVNTNTQEGMDRVKSMESAMNEIESANEKLTDFSQIISDIEEKTKVINDIVFKTQLLSFNASIEAARAGQHGRGFAVVAEEVGSLAELSGKAATEISSLLGNSSNQVRSLVEYNTDVVKKGKDITNSVVESFSKINNYMDSMQENIDEITQATKEQSIGISEVNKAIQALEESSQQSSNASEKFNHLANESRMASDEIKSVSDTIDKIIYGGGKRTKAETFDLKSKVSQVINKKADFTLDDDDEPSGDDASFKHIA
jgi:methyl-accepting chemotaxis protein